MTDKWKSATLGDIGPLQPLFDSAANAAEVNKAALSVAKAQYETGKALALASLNPLVAALSIIIDEIDKNLQDLENLGFFSLFVNSGEDGAPENVNEAPSYGRFFYGTQEEVDTYWDINNELVGAINGKTVKNHPPRGKNTEDTTQYSVGTDIPYATDSFGNRLKKLVPYYKTSSSSGGKRKNKSTGLLEMTPSDIITTMVQAFSDEGDLKPQYLDANNNFVDSESLAAVSPTTKQKLITYIDNKPTFSENADVGGLVLIFGASDVSKYRDLVFSLKEFFNFTEFDELLNSLNKLLSPPQINVKVQDVHKLVSYKPDNLTNKARAQASNFTSVIDKLKDGETMVLVEVDGEAGNTTGFEGQIVQASDLEAPEINKTIPPATKPVNINTLPYYQETLLLQPLNSFNSAPKPGFLLVEAEEKVYDENIQTGKTDENLKNQKLGQKLTANPKYKDSTEDLPNAEKEWIPKKATKNPMVCRVRVKEEKPSSVPPNFNSYKLVDLIPALGTVLRDIRGEVNSYRGLVTIANQGIQDTIDAIDKRVKKVENVANNIIAIQEQIANLKNIGLYALTLDPQKGGTAKFIERLQQAENSPPNSLKYSAGALFIGGTPTEKSGEGLKQAFDTLKAILNL